jgi:predicted RNA-binding protein YlqC (UPF0109 family)
MRDLVLYLAESLANEPEAVTLREQRRGDGAVLALRVADADLGTIIGRQGRTVRAIRTVVAAAAAKRDENWSVVVADSSGRRSW